MLYHHHHFNGKLGARLYHFAKLFLSPHCSLRACQNRDRKLYYWGKRKRKSFIRKMCAPGGKRTGKQEEGKAGELFVFFCCAKLGGEIPPPSLSISIYIYIFLFSFSPSEWENVSKKGGGENLWLLGLA